MRPLFFFVRDRGGRAMSAQTLARSIDALGHAMAADALKADHYLHLRCEITSPPLPSGAPDGSDSG